MECEIDYITNCATLCKLFKQTLSSPLSAPVNQIIVRIGTQVHLEVQLKRSSLVCQQENCSFPLNTNKPCPSHREASISFHVPDPCEEGVRALPLTKSPIQMEDRKQLAAVIGAAYNVRQMNAHRVSHSLLGTGE